MTFERKCRYGEDIDEEEFMLVSDGEAYDETNDA
jgi:hypothetical protein